MTGYEIKQGSAAYPLVFLMVDSTDHISGKAGLTPTVVISKAGGAFASPSGAVSEVGNGWYKVAGNAADAGTLGPLLLHATAAGADPTDVIYPVVAVDPQSGTNYGLSDLDAAVSSRMASFTLPANFSSLAVGTGGSVTVGNYLAGQDPASLVLDATASLHDAAGTIGAEINAAGGSGDPWATALPGAYAAGTAGYLVGHNLDAAVSSRLASASYSAAPTAAAIAAAVLTDATSADLATAGSLGHLVTTAPPWYSAPATPPTTAEIAAAILATPANLLATDASGRVTSAATTLDLTQPLAAARALDAVADTSLTLNDALHCAVASAAGKQTVSGTTYTVETPSTGTALRTFTLDSATSPTSRT